MNFHELPLGPASVRFELGGGKHGRHYRIELAQGDDVLGRG